MIVFTVIEAIVLLIVANAIATHQFSEIISKKEEHDIFFLLFTRSEKMPFYLIPGNMENLLQTPFEPGLPSKIIIHGYLSSCKDDIFINIKEAYFQQSQEYNVMCVDWSQLAKDSYGEAIDRTWLVGISLSILLDWLVMAASINLDEVHLIGHSLGAHVAGVAGYNIEFGNLGRITGLDPATPMITFSPEKTLDTSDALIVEIIFTSILAYGHPIGHINYYLNGGLWQPECEFRLSEYKTNKRKYRGNSDIVCNHSRAYKVFAEAILCPHCFLALPCIDVVSAMENSCCENCGNSYYMFDLDFMIDGIYAVKTKSPQVYNTE